MAHSRAAQHGGNGAQQNSAPAVLRASFVRLGGFWGLRIRSHMERYVFSFTFPCGAS